MLLATSCDLYFYAANSFCEAARPRVFPEFNATIDKITTASTNTTTTSTTLIETKKCAKRLYFGFNVNLALRSLWWSSSFFSCSLFLCLFLLLLLCSLLDAYSMNMTAYMWNRLHSADYLDCSETRWQLQRKRGGGGKKEKVKRHAKDGWILRSLFQKCFHH